MGSIHQQTESEIRKKYISKLSIEYGFDEKNIRLDVPVQLGLKRFIADAIIYQDDRPFVLVEIKTDLTLNFEQAKNTLEQMSSVLGNNFVILTNGYYDICYEIEKSSKQIKFNEIPDIPALSKDKRTKKNPPQLELNEPEPFFYGIFESLQNDPRLLHVTEKEIVDDLHKIIGAKIFDEKNSGTSLFFARKNDSYLKIVSRLEELLHQINSKENNFIFDLDFKLPHDLISKIVFKLQKYSLTKSQLKNMPLGFSQGILSKSTGAYLTPDAISEFMSHLFKINSKMKVLDLACGSGAFLVNAGKFGASVVGVDANRQIANIAKINCYLNGIKNASVICADSLGPLENLAKMSSGNIQTNSFDLVLTHPPFGLRLTKDYANFSMLTISGNRFMESLFIERSWELLKEGGKLIIILPEGITSNKSTRKIREFITTNFKVLGIISLPDYAFFPYSSIKTTILVLEKLGPKIISNSYMIFTAYAKNLGYDKQGILAKESDFSKILEDFNKFLQTNKGSKFDQNLNSDLRLDENYFQNTSDLGNQTNMCMLKDIADITIGVKNSKLKKDTKYLLVKGQQIKDFEVDLSNASEVGVEFSIEKYLLQKGDIAITRSGTVGNVGLCNKDANVIFSDNIIRIRINSDKIISQYLASFLYSELGQRQIRQCTTGSTIRGISLSNLEKIQIPLISISKQHKIANDLKKILDAKSELNHLIKNLENSKTSLSKNVEKTIEELLN